MFVTVFYGILDVNTGEVNYCNAGHNPPYLLKSNGQVEALPMSQDPMVGAIDGIEYHESSVQLAKGDALVMFTDGVTEAMDSECREFGEERLESTLAAVTSYSCQQIIEAVRADVATFVGEAEQSDDITVLALKRI
jgi:sigma-B regulation protein RsbU (phosphoserine phosphatase)